MAPIAEELASRAAPPVEEPVEEEDSESSEEDEEASTSEVEETSLVLDEVELEYDVIEEEEFEAAVELLTPEELETQAPPYSQPALASIV